MRGGGRGRRRGGTTAVTLDAWLPEKREEAILEFDLALHDLEYETLRHELRRRFYTVEEVAERAGVDPRIVLPALRDRVRQEEYGWTARSCRRSVYGVCVQHRVNALYNGPYGPAWQAYYGILGLRNHLRSCQAGSLCMIRSEHLAEVERELLRAPYALGIDDLELYERWLGIDMEKLKHMVESLEKSDRAWYRKRGGSHY